MRSLPFSLCFAPPCCFKGPSPLRIQRLPQDQASCNTSRLYHAVARGETMRRPPKLIASWAVHSSRVAAWLDRGCLIPAVRPALSARGHCSSTVFCACARAAARAGRTWRGELTAGNYAILRAFPVGMDITRAAALHLLRLNLAADGQGYNPAIKMQTLIHRYFGGKARKVHRFTPFLIY